MAKDVLVELEKSLKQEIEAWSSVGLVKAAFGPTRIGDKLTWQNYQSGLSMSAWQDYGEEHTTLHQQNQYTLSFHDDGFIQIFIEATGGGISSAKFAFYPRPLGYASSSAIRLDWSPSQHKVASHADAHLQSTRLQEFRIPSRVLPRPELFMELVIRQAYWKSWCVRFPRGAEIISSIESNPDRRQWSTDKHIPELNISDIGRFYGKFRSISSLVHGRSNWLDNNSMTMVCAAGH